MEPDTLSPYVAPRAAVEGAPADLADAGPPPALRQALRIFWVSFAINLVFAALELVPALRGEVPASKIVGVMLAALIVAWVYRKLGRGRNWARVLLLCVGVVTLGTSLYGLVTQGAAAYVGRSGLPFLLLDLLRFYAYGLLLTPAVKAWFLAVKKRDEEEQAMKEQEHA